MLRRTAATTRAATWQRVLPRDSYSCLAGKEEPPAGQTDPAPPCYQESAFLSDSISFATLEEEGFAQHLFDDDRVCPGSLKEDSPNKSGALTAVCRMQASFIDGGVLLVAKVSHIVCDGRGVTEIIRIFAENFRKAQAGDINHFPSLLDKRYFSNRCQLLKGSEFPSRPIDAHPAWTVTPSSSTTTGTSICSRIYQMRAESLVALKNAASAILTDNTKWITTNDAICAFIWQSVMVARHRAQLLSAGSEVHLAQPVDCRDKIGLESPYFGNAVYMTHGTLSFDELAHPITGLPVAAQLSRNQIKNVTGDKFKDLVGHAQRADEKDHVRMRITDHLQSSGLIVTSHFKFALYEIDFGPAVKGRRAKALRFPARASMAGTVVVFPRLEDGSCEFMLTEGKCTLDHLAEQSVFCNYTDTRGVISPDSPALDPDLPPTPPLSDPGRQSSVPKDGSVKARHNATDRAALAAASHIDVHTETTHHAGVIKIITLNRPNAKNAINIRLLCQLHQEVEQLYEEQESCHGRTRVLILASAVNGTFCAGADLKERMAMNDEQVEYFLTMLRKTTDRLAALPIPTIAAVAGHALGGSLELALCCDFRVFASNSVVRLPETRLGIIPGAGATYRLSDIIGISRAKDLILTGRQIQGPEAFFLGLCNRLINVNLCEDDHSLCQAPRLSPRSTQETARILTLDGAVKLAREISGGAPLAVEAALEAMSRNACGAVEAAAYATLLHTTDRLEGLASFAEKRVPRFTGR